MVITSVQTSIEGATNGISRKAQQTLDEKIAEMETILVVNKHQFIEDEEAILEVIEVDDDVDEGVDVSVHLEANAGDHDGKDDQGFDGVDVPEEMVDMATCSGLGNMQNNGLYVL
ncbi:hypothetical protein JTB14_008953 [Gonioctena quinquepunctata]|nr:hypothetical protein JTB14_008953 [Gonioctena quinquepunctata]